MLLLLSLFTPLAAGCASWHSAEDGRIGNRGLPAPKKHPGGVTLEVAFVSILPPTLDEDGNSRPPLDEKKPPDDDDARDEQTSSPSDAAAPRREVEDIWHWVDETVVAAEVRHELQRNGLRIGQASNTSEFARRLNRIRRMVDETTEVLETAEVESDLLHEARIITCRIGKRYELPVRQPSTSDRDVLVSRRGGIVGKTLSASQPLLALRATSADLHSVRLSLVPEIQHGAMKQSWVGSDAALRLENRRDTWTLPELLSEVRMEKGGILVVGGMQPPQGLGAHMFTGTTSDGDTDHVLVVIRVLELPEWTTP